MYVLRVNVLQSSERILTYLAYFLSQIMDDNSKTSLIK